MNKLKYVLSFVFIMIIAAAVFYFIYMNGNKEQNSLADLSGAKEIAESGFFDEFDKFVSSYDTTVNTTVDTTNTTETVIHISIGDHLGSISIPSISLESDLFFGDDESELSRGVGVDPRQKAPGQNGNVILAGHNNMAFGALGGLTIGDEVILNTSYGVYKYKVDNYRVAKSDDRTVIVSKDHESLTMYTCYPFDEYNTTTERFVVTCTFVGRE